jgi:predicted nucleotidyltransferase
MTNALQALGEHARLELERCLSAMQAAIADELLAVVVYGSAARGEYQDGVSDVDVLIVMRTAGREHLDAIANALAVARFSARIEAMILTKDELPRSCDVFPLFYDDIRRHHVLLHGADPFAALEISDAHRRHRIEQELREANIRMRRAVVDALGQPEPLARAVLRKAKQMRTPLHALLSLKGLRVSDGFEDVLRSAGQHYDVDTAPILRASENAPAAHRALVALLTHAIDDVDRLGELR